MGDVERRAFIKRGDKWKPWESLADAERKAWAAHAAARMGDAVNWCLTERPEKIADFKREVRV